MAYSEEVMKRFEHPTHVGSLDKADPNVGVGMAGAPACGDVAKLSILVNPDTNVIEVARFLGFGCGSLIASSQKICEMIEGKTVEEAEQIENTVIAGELCLPPVKIHCSLLAEDVVKAAIADYRTKQARRRATTA